MVNNEVNTLVWLLNPHQSDLISTKLSVELGKNIKSHWEV